MKPLNLRYRSSQVSSYKRPKSSPISSWSFVLVSIVKLINKPPKLKIQGYHNLLHLKFHQLNNWRLWKEKSQLTWVYQQVKKNKINRDWNLNLTKFLIKINKNLIQGTQGIYLIQKTEVDLALDSNRNQVRQLDFQV